MNPIDQFVQMAKQRFGNNIDPRITALNLMGMNGNPNSPQTPQQALLQMYQSGRINQQQYETYMRMI
jgi:hypothetical protein